MYNKNDELIFEGEYLNGKKLNGRGYHLNNSIIYELKNGKGIVKECDWNDELKFEVEYKNGEKLKRKRI